MHEVHGETTAVMYAGENTCVCRTEDGSWQGDPDRTIAGRLPVFISTDNGSDNIHMINSEISNTVVHNLCLHSNITYK